MYVTYCACCIDILKRPPVTTSTIINWLNCDFSPDINFKKTHMYNIIARPLMKSPQEWTYHGEHAYTKKICSMHFEFILNNFFILSGDFVFFHRLYSYSHLCCKSLTCILNDSDRRPYCVLRSDHANGMRSLCSSLWKHKILLFLTTK